MFVEDTAPFFTDFGVVCVAGSETVRVLLDEPDNTVLGDMQILTQPSMIYRAADLPSLARGDSVTVAGTAYVVGEITRDGFTGGFMRATLK